MAPDLSISTESGGDGALDPYDPYDIGESTLVVTFDYDVEGKPLKVVWPITRGILDLLLERLATAAEDELGFFAFSPNRVRRDVWINLARVREVNFCFDFGSSAGLPSTLIRDEEDPDEDAPEAEEPDAMPEGLSDRWPVDLYPFAAIAFRGSEHSYGSAGRWLELHEASAEGIALLVDDIELDAHAAFITFEDDDGEYRSIRKRDIAFIDLASTDGEEYENGGAIDLRYWFVAERPVTEPGAEPEGGE